jgi:hypothetical protein
MELKKLTHGYWYGYKVSRRLLEIPKGGGELKVFLIINDLNLIIKHN